MFTIFRQKNSSDGLASAADRLKLPWLPMCCEAIFIDCSVLISRFRIVLAAVLLNCAITSSVTADTGVRVVTSIKPVHSLVSAVMAGVDKPHLIMQDAMSPHTFSMRPSDAVALEDADVIFLIDELLETSLANPIDTLASNARVVPLFHAQGSVHRALREGGTFETHDHGHHVEDGHSEENEAVHREDDSDDHISHDHSWHEEIDPHIWLDPVNAAAMVRVIADTLYKADPANAELYADNAQVLLLRLEELTTQIAADLASVQGKPFIVFHDGYRYFEDRFGLAAAGSAVISPDRSPGVRRILELQDKIRDLGATCVFAEPQFDMRIVNVIIEGTETRVGTVDPLGASIENGPELYFTLLHNMAASFKDCLVAVDQS